jgi:hypothetical protein
MVTESSTSSYGKHKAFHASNLTADEENKILRNCELGQSGTEHSDSESYSDTNQEREIDRYETGDIEG